MHKFSKQVRSAHYMNLEYESKGRFVSYWHQIFETLHLYPRSILEIGTGSGLVSSTLRKLDLELCTLDIDSDLNPTKIGTVMNIPWQDNSFDVVVCCQVLEHLPFSDFQKALSEICRVSKRAAVISLPDSTRYYRVFFHIPFLKTIKSVIDIPIFPQDHIFVDQHYWEIGKKNYPLSKIIHNIMQANFIIKSSYRVFENPFHRFFILSKE